MTSSSGARRRSGIPVVGDLPWGSHFCQFYRTRQDMIDIVVPYLRAGLEQGELCVWVASDFLATDLAIEALRRGVPGYDGFASRKQIEVLPHTDWYLKGGSFDLDRTLAMWMAKHDEALERGYAGLRVTGTPYWIDNKRDWDDFAAYEAAINRVIGGTRLLVLCTYSLEKCGVVEILDVVRNHEFALAMNQGTWQLINGPARSGVVSSGPSKPS